MELSLRRDFARVSRRWEAFWSGESLDRPMLLIQVPRCGIPCIDRPYPVRPDRAIGPQIEQALAAMNSWEYLGEAVPGFMMEFAAEHFAGFLGAKLRYHDQYDRTGWAEPFVKDWDSADLRLVCEGECWQKTLEYCREMRRRCDAHFLINAPVLSAGLDVLAAVRGTQELLLDLVDRPEQVLEALARVRLIYEEVVSELAVELGWLQRGSADWNGMYHSQKANTIQCDFSCMIGREMFGRFAVPCLRHQGSFYGGVTYHLDGPQAVQHLETICGLPEIDIIQYVPVPGEEPEPIESVYRRALQLGKGIVRTASPQLARQMWRDWPGRRLVFHVQMESRQQAEQFLASFA